MNFTGTSAELTHPFTSAQTQLVRGKQVLLMLPPSELPPQMAANSPHHGPHGPQPTQGWVKQWKHHAMKDGKE